MGVRACFVCDEMILKGEPRIYLDRLAIHEYCSPDSTGKLGAMCDTPNCQYRWQFHAGSCVV